MSALGRFGRFTLFSPRVSHSNTCRLLSFVCCVLLFGFVALVCFCFLFCECLGIPNSPRSLDLDDRQGLIARSAMQQKEKSLIRLCTPIPVKFDRQGHSCNFYASTSMTSSRPTLPLLALFRTLLIKTVTSLSLTQSNASLSFIGLLKPATNVLSSWPPGLRVN